MSRLVKGASVLILLLCLGIFAAQGDSLEVPQLSDTRIFLKTILTDPAGVYALEEARLGGPFKTRAWSAGGGTNAWQRVILPDELPGSSVIDAIQPGDGLWNFAVLRDNASALWRLRRGNPFPFSEFADVSPQFTDTGGEIRFDLTPDSASYDVLEAGPALNALQPASTSVTGWDDGWTVGFTNSAPDQQFWRVRRFSAQIAGPEILPELADRIGRNTNLVNVCPYDKVMAGPANFGGLGQQQSMSFLQYGHTYRVRQDGVIELVSLFLTNRAAIASFTLQVWREQPNGNFNLVSSTDNLASSLIDGVNQLPVQLEAAEGDYLGGSIRWLSAQRSTNHFYLAPRPARSRIGGEPTAGLLYVYDLEPSPSDAPWLTAAAKWDMALVIEGLAQAPEGVVIGDSITSGSYQNNSFIDTYSKQSKLEISYPRKLGKLLGMRVQNMGIAANTTTKILARLTNDVLRLHPKFAIIQCGVNDIFQNVEVEATRNNVWAMTKAVVDHGIVPVIFLTGPWHDPNVGLHGGITRICIERQAAAKAYNAILVDSRPLAGKFLPGGIPGNLFDLKEEFSDPWIYDGHYNDLGNTVLARALAEQIMNYYKTTPVQP